MDNISEILKEAKPLYFQRKRNRAITKKVLSLLFPVILFTGILGTNYYNDDSYIALSNVSVIEEMGLPVDDYGLLEFN